MEGQVTEVGLDSRVRATAKPLGGPITNLFEAISYHSIFR